VGGLPEKPRKWQSKCKDRRRICARSHRRQISTLQDVATNLTELKKVSSWQQGSFVEKGGWATLPGSDLANSAVAEACAKLLGSLSKLGYCAEPSGRSGVTGCQAECLPRAGAVTLVSKVYALFR
jgi:hypothetical protein